MILQIELNPEMAERLCRLAAEAGKDPAIFAREILARSVAQREARSGRGPIATKKWLASWRELAAQAKPLGYIVDDSRESIYEGCGE
jgi:hypothetical protein